MAKFFDNLKKKADFNFQTSNEAGAVGGSAVSLPGKHGVSIGVSWKKFSQKKVPVILVIFALPIIAAGLLLVTDPTALPLLKVALAKTDSESKNLYTEAINKRKDPEILVKRAELFATMTGKEKEEEADLVAASKAGDKAASNIYKRAICRLGLVGIDNKTKALLNDCVKSSAAHHQAFAFDHREDGVLISNCAYSLLTCGEYKRVVEICKIPPREAFGEGEIEFFKAVIDRENGNTSSAAALLSHCRTNMHAELYAEPDFFKTLMALDKKDFAWALKHSPTTYLSDTGEDVQCNDWSKDLIQAWAYYGQGNLKKSIEHSNAVIKDFTETERPDFVGANGLAASYLLKTHALMAQNQKTSAIKCFQNYKELQAQGVTGKLVIPIPYRKWIDQTAI